MKIITSEAIYIQKKDLFFLNQTNLSIPSSISLNAFYYETTIIDDDDIYEFIKFEEEIEIDFLKKIDWIVDYNNLKDLEEYQIIKLIEDVGKEKNNIFKKYNNNIIKNKDLLLRYEQLEFKITTLIEILWLKQGHIKLNFPEEIYFIENSKKIKEKQKRKKYVFKYFEQ